MFDVETKSADAEAESAAPVVCVSSEGGDDNSDEAKSLAYPEDIYWYQKAVYGAVYAKIEELRGMYRPLELSFRFNGSYYCNARGLAEALCDTKLPPSDRWRAVQELAEQIGASANNPIPPQRRELSQEEINRLINERALKQLGGHKGTVERSDS